MTDPEKLVRFGSDCAQELMIKEGHLRPLVIGWDIKGNNYYYFNGWQDDKARIQTLNTLRIYLALDRIVEYVFICEAWGREINANDNVKDHKVSDKSDRQEMISVSYAGKNTLAINGTEKRGRLMRFKRDNKGDVIPNSFEEAYSKMDGTLEGDLFDLISPKLLEEKDLEDLRKITKNPNWATYAKNVERIAPKSKAI